MIKKTFKLLLLLLCFIISNKVFAETNVNVSYNHNYNWSGGSSGGGSTPSGPPKPNGSYSETQIDNNGKVHSYKCEYYYSTNVDTTVTVNSYDLTGKSLMSGSTIIDETFKSGTWIGLRNNETKTATWSIDKNSLKCKETLYNYTCVYSKDISNTKYQKINSTIGASSDEECKNKCLNKNPTYPYHEWLESGACTCTRYVSTTSTSTDYKKKYYTNEPTNECPRTYDGYEFLKKENETSQEFENNNQIILSNAHNNAKQKARNEAINKIGDPISTVEYIKEKKDGTIEIDSLPHNKVAEYNPYKEISNGDWSGVIQTIYEFKPYRVCMNILTGTITYKNEGECGENEKNVNEGKGKDNKNYWRYFIPLNTLTGSNFYIRLGKKNSNTKLSKEECASVMEEYPLEDDYLKYINSASGKSFTGIQSIDEKDVKNANGCLKKNKKISVNECLNIMNNHQIHNDYTHYIKSLNENVIFTDKKSNEVYNINDIKKNNGCRFSITINYNIVQMFYGEKTKSGYTSLKGYGIYFRQIDINNPFPNSISSTSIWHGLYNALNKKVNTGNGEVKLSSFDNITYRAVISNQNADKIRKFNESTSYTQWIKDFGKQNGMNLDGTSNFIQSNSTIFVNKQSKSSFYSLGCGPANKDWSGCS